METKAELDTTRLARARRSKLCIHHFVEQDEVRGQRSDERGLDDQHRRPRGCQELDRVTRLDRMTTNRMITADKGGKC